MSVESDEIWAEFDALVASAATAPPNPWSGTPDPRFRPDFDLLSRLLEIPLNRGAGTQSGMRAKAVDVWIAAELRRAGFDKDGVWPRGQVPRVQPRDIGRLLKALPVAERRGLSERLQRNPAGIVSADARILGRAYYKQVDVVLSHWATGPELLISTKRMDSSVSNNALNRVEESYGDAHNLRGRHPLAAIGYVLLTSTHALEAAGTTPRRLLDLIERLAKEPGGYDASAVIVADWDRDVARGALSVTIDTTWVNEALSISRFFETIIAAVLDRTPVEDHVTARQLFSAT